MRLAGCEHCGFVRQQVSESDVQLVAGDCPECGRAMTWLSQVDARDLIQERMAAQRFRRQALTTRSERLRSAGGPPPEPTT